MDERERRNPADLATQGPIEPFLEVGQRAVRTHTRCFLNVATEIERERVGIEFADGTGCGGYPWEVTGIAPGGQRASVALVCPAAFGGWCVGWRRRGGRGGYRKGDGCGR